MTTNAKHIGAQKSERQTNSRSNSFDEQCIHNTHTLTHTDGLGSRNENRPQKYKIGFSFVVKYSSKYAIPRYYVVHGEEGNIVIPLFRDVGQGVSASVCVCLRTVFRARIDLFPTVLTLGEMHTDTQTNRCARAHTYVRGVKYIKKLSKNRRRLTCVTARTPKSDALFFSRKVLLFSRQIWQRRRRWQPRQRDRRTVCVAQYATRTARFDDVSSVVGFAFLSPPPLSRRRRRHSTRARSKKMSRNIVYMATRYGVITRASFNTFPRPTDDTAAINDRPRSPW